MPEALTARQRAIYEFIAARVRAQGIPPSLTEIARAFGLASASGVVGHLKAIERKGYIRRRPGISRGIELVVEAFGARGTSLAVRVPVVGAVPARRRLQAAGDASNYLLVDARLAPTGAVAVRVQRRGLEARGILRGDYLIVLRDRRPRRGDLALARLRRGLALVEVLAGPRQVRCLDGDRELEGAELIGRVAAVLRSMD